MGCGCGCSSLRNNSSAICCCAGGGLGASSSAARASDEEVGSARGGSARASASITGCCCGCDKGCSEVRFSPGIPANGSAGGVGRRGSTLALCALAKKRHRSLCGAQQLLDVNARIVKLSRESKAVGANFRKLQDVSSHQTKSFVVFVGPPPYLNVADSVATILLLFSFS